ncbi:MAG TPA: hypothetical protein VEK79_07445 [Thermoanaerobaculia bacterium]|nr:hypothetical protein [Thermoanaerobaculia bacterium]
MSFQDHARDAAIRALDAMADRIGDTGEKAVHRLAQHWRTMDDKDKRELMEVVLAAGTAAGVAIAAVREKKGPKKKKTGTLAKKAGRKALDKVVRTAAKTLKKAKK